MTLLHPKLRQALLADPVHKTNGLNAEKLIEYDQLVAKLYYLRQSSANTEELEAEIEEFREYYMPHFSPIHKRWVESQRQGIKNLYWGTRFSLFDRVKKLLSLFKKEKKDKPSQPQKVRIP
ncbi:hypothetical protein JW935_02250 [candidate division KSB1 bacterium]|nr:hypothetical protein [candidate division KSB1 bacterium]